MSLRLRSEIILGSIEQNFLTNFPLKSKHQDFDQKKGPKLQKGPNVTSTPTIDTNHPIVASTDGQTTHPPNAGRKGTSFRIPIHVFLPFLTISPHFRPKRSQKTTHCQIHHQFRNDHQVQHLHSFYHFKSATELQITNKVQKQERIGVPYTLPPRTKE